MNKRQKPFAKINRDLYFHDCGCEFCDQTDDGEETIENIKNQIEHLLEENPYVDVYLVGKKK